MLSDYEKKLYMLAKVDNKHDIIAMRRDIEWFLIDTVSKCGARVKNLPASLAALIPKNSHEDDRALDWLKMQLNLDLYTFDDYRIDELIVYLTTDNVDAFNKVLEMHPELIHRRSCENMRPLLHEAIAHKKVWAVQLLIDKGASLETLSGYMGFNAIERACDNRSMHEMMPAFFQHARQYEVVRGMMAYNNDESSCLDALQKTPSFAQPNTQAEKVNLLSLAVEKRYYKVIKHLVLDHVSLNTPDSKFIMPLHYHAIGEIDKMRFHDRAQCTAPGLVSFLLAAGANPMEAGANGRSLFYNIETEARQLWPTFAIAGVEVSVQCWLFTTSAFPVVILTKPDYDLLKQANLLDLNKMVCIVCEEKNVFTVHYKKYGIEETLSSKMLHEFLQQRLAWLIAFLYPKWIDAGQLSFPPFKDSQNRFDYITMMFNTTRANIVSFKESLLSATVNKPLSVEVMTSDEDKAILWVSSTYPDRAIPLYDKAIEDIIVAAKRRGFSKLLDFIYDQLQVNDQPKNIKPLLYQSLDFTPARFTREIVKRFFTGMTPFYQVMQSVGDVLNVERASHPHAALVKKNKLSPNAPIISEFDILKEIKKVYLSRLEANMSNPEWHAVRVAIRDSLVLGYHTLFLNLIRSNRDLTKLKNTATYMKICKLVESVEISEEAKITLKERVIIKPTFPDIRQVLMYLALVCDFKKEKAEFIIVCRRHLMGEGLSLSTKEAINATLRLLSEDDRKKFNGRLLDVSHDEVLSPMLKANLASKDCAIIEIIRTNINNCKVTDTKTFKVLVEKLTPPPAVVVAPAVEVSPKKTWHPSALFAILRPNNPEAHNANIDANTEKKDKKEEKSERLHPL